MTTKNVELGTPANRNLQGLVVPTPHFWKLHITLQMLRITFVMDRAYIDFQRLFVFTLSSAFTGVLSDQTVIPFIRGRLVHHCVILELNIPSYRMEQAKKNRDTAPDSGEVN